MSITIRDKSMKALMMTGLLLSVAVFTPGQVQAQSDVQSRLRRIENELDTLNRAVYRGETPPPGSVSSGGGGIAAENQVRLQQLSSEVQELRGLVEQQTFQMRQLRQEVERQTSDMALRLQDLEKNKANAVVSRGSDYVVPKDVRTGAGAPPAAQDTTQVLGTLKVPGERGGAITEPPPILSTSSSMGAADATALYEGAFAQLKNGDYANAAKQFELFRTTYPEHNLAGNAVYWLGETHYVRGDFERAAQIFAQGYQQYPDSAKSPDNLLKLAMSLASLGNSADACIALDQLEISYKDGPKPVMRRAEQERAKLNCGG